MDDGLDAHYRVLLGLDDNWVVSQIEITDLSVVIGLESQGRFRCRDCGVVCGLKDHSPLRRWRHLDVMQYTTVLKARVPRTDCGVCGVKTCSVPWADKSVGFTLMFETWCVKVLKTASSVEAARKLLNVSWDTLNTIMKRAVDRGVGRRVLDGVKHVGVDEKSFGKGHDYVSVLTDIEGKRVVEVVEGRDTESADQLFGCMTDPQKDGVEAACIDMWQAFENSVKCNLGNVDVVHDKFHIVKYLKDAVNRTRRAEHKKLLADGDETLTKTRWLWLYNQESLSFVQKQRFKSLKKSQLKTARAWAITEMFRKFWDYVYVGSATKFFGRWYSWAIRSRLPAIKKVASMLKKRLHNIVTYLKHRITNGAAEGFNSRIQNIRTSARGLTNFENYRTRILFHCGKLDLIP